MLQPVLPLGTPHKTTPRTVAALGDEAAAASRRPGHAAVVIATSRHANVISTPRPGSARPRGPWSATSRWSTSPRPSCASRWRTTFVHVRYADKLRQTLIAVTLFVLGAAAAVLLSDRVGFRRDDDALSRLALVATFLGLVTIVTYPLYNAYARNLETRADRESLAALGDRGRGGAGARALRRPRPRPAVRPPLGALVLRRPPGPGRAHRGRLGHAPTPVPAAAPRRPRRVREPA